MTRLTIGSGLNENNRLPNSQIIIVGQGSYLKNLEFGKLSSKLVGVNEEVFKEATSRLSRFSVIPLYLNLAKVVSLPSESSRHNSPSNADALFRELKSTSIAEGIKKLSVVLFSPFDHVLAHVAAVSKAFPTYSRKTKKNFLEDIDIEIVVTNEKKLSENDVKFLNSMGKYMTICANQVDAPCNEFNSEVFANEAAKMVDELDADISKTIIVGEELKEKGFGGIYNVGKAAIHPPIFAAFSYTPSGASKNFALVGKGIVYDTGGMQIKTKTMMPSMKNDMAGAAALLGAFCTLPDDIITMLSGKTVEISNTDSEGRLVLADGVYYAKHSLKADVIIDMATLTGAQPFATGRIHGGVMTNSEEWENKAMKAGKASGDLVHPLIFAPDLHFLDLNSQVADMKNTNLGSMIGAPSSVAGLFIASHIDFAKDSNWVHFDIATPAFNDERSTAFGIPLICKLLGEYVEANVAK
ncbi:hypothetical protein FO519_009221 [Halicephalobus sp. NKZ332]|nr:hypothetical protein FO519_009221 [Halicephalobus sp. NKZ332]